jgi:hypothetical protein
MISIWIKCYKRKKLILAEREKNPKWLFLLRKDAQQSPVEDKW